MMAGEGAINCFYLVVNSCQFFVTQLKLQFSCFFNGRCNIVVQCEAMWDLARSCATDDMLFNKLPPRSRRQLCRCLMLPVIAKFDDGQKDVYIQLVSRHVLLLIFVANKVISLF